MMKKALILLIIVGSFEQYIWGQGQSKNVLFIGNSYSEYVPWLVENIASSMGDNLNYGSSIITVGGYSLYLHSSQPSTLSLIRQGGWDLVVLQDHSRYPSEPINFVEEYVYPYAQYLDEQINMYNPGAETMFYMTWGRRDGDADRCPVNPPVCTYIGMDDLTRERYMYMAEVNHAVISPVSAVWRYIRQNHPSIELYQSDGSHPSDAGFYAAACCFYTAIFRRDPRLITYNYNLSSDNADKIKNAAKLVVFDNLLTWHIGEYDQDTQAPTVPSGLSASNITPASFTLSWNASTDNIGVTGYDVYRNGTLVNTVTTTSVNITGLAASTTYSMTVRAKDAAGNISDPSTALNVTTSVPPDTQPPTIPTGLTANNITQTSFTLTWLASTDNVAVTGYDVYRNGNFLSTVAATSSNITGLTAGTTYSMTVRAKDAAGNISDPSIALNVTTTSAPDTQAPSIPTGLSASNISPTSFTLTWSASTDNVAVTGYDVYRNGTLLSSVTSPSATIAELAPSTTYSMTVSAKDAAGNISGQSTPLNVTTSAAPDTQPPSAPTNLSAIDIAATSFTLTWTASTDNVGVTGYDVYRNGTLVNSVTSTTANISGLTSGITYSMTVRAKDEAGNLSPSSSAINVTTLDNQAPTVPSNLAASNITQTSFTLTWSASTDNVGVTGYDIYRNSSLYTSVTGTSVNITGLSASTTYAITVRAKDAAGNISSASNVLNVTTANPPDTQAPSVPTGLYASNISETSFTLTWSASTDNVGVTGYDVYRNGAFFSSVTSNSANISGLTASTIYAMTVRAKDAAGNISSSSSVLNVTTADLHSPSTPTGLSATNITETSFTLSWSASTDNVGVSGYDVYRGGTLINSTTGTSLNITGLSPGTNYSMSVRAKDAADNISPSSVVLHVLTADTHAPTVPSGLVASNIAETSFTLSWAASTDNAAVTGYDVYRNGNLYTTVTGTSANISGLAPSTTYSMTVRAKDAANNISGPSSSLSVTTIDTHAPSVPSGLSANNITETSFTLTWSASTDNVGVTGYDVFINGTLESSLSATSLNVTGLSAWTNYSVTVRAKDAAGNISGSSSVFNVTTADIHSPTVPSNLTSTSITETSFTLSWSASSDNVRVTRYEVFRNGSQVTSVSSTSANITGLSPSTTYSMTVRAADAAGNVSPASTALNVTTIDIHPPSVPAGLTATGITETSFTLLWSPSSDNVGVTGYDVYCNGILINSLTGTSANITGLTFLTNYSMTVRARDAAGNISNASTALVVRTPDTHAPSVPTGLAATNITETSFTLIWSASSDNAGVSGYDVYRNGNLITTVSGTSANITGLTAASIYSMTVRARDASGNLSPLSEVLRVNTSDTHAPTIPNNLKASDLTETSFTLTWDPSTDNVGVSKYEVYCNDILHVTVTTPRADINGLTVFTVYSITVRAFDAAGNSSAMSQKINVKTPDMHSPTTPQNLIAKNISKASFTLSWTPSSDNVKVSGYQVYSNGLIIATVQESYYSFSNLDDKVEYEIRIVAIDESGNSSDPSDPFKITTSDYDPLTKAQLSLIKIYPVPIRGNEFYIDLGRKYNGDLKVEIFNMNGVKMSHNEIFCSGEILTIPNTISKNGLYFLRIGDNITTVTRRIVINRE